MLGMQFATTLKHFLWFSIFIFFLLTPLEPFLIFFFSQPWDADAIFFREIFLDVFFLMFADAKISAEPGEE